MKLRQSPPLIAQLLASLAVLAGIYVALGIVATYGLSGGSRDYDTPWWTGILRFCTILLFYSIPALGYHLVHQFFCWAFNGSGYPTRYPRIHFRRLLFFIFATIAVASNTLYWVIVTGQTWLPPPLESVLGFGIIQSAIMTACVTATLLRDSRKLFWMGVAILLGCVTSLIFQQTLPAAAGYNLIARFLSQ